MHLACRHVCDRSRQAADVGRRTGVAKRRIAQLAVAIGAPAFGGAIDHGARVHAAGSYGGDAAGEADRAHRFGAVGRRAIAQAPIGVDAPALHAAAGRDHAGVRRADCQRRDAAAQASHIHGRGSIGGGAIAKLAAGIPAPTLDPATAGKSAAMPGAGSHRHHAAAQPGNIHRRGLGRGRTISQLAGGVEAPTFDAASGGQDAGVQSTCRQRRHVLQRGERGILGERTIV